MLYKNKIKVQNILKSAVALMLMFTLSLSTALSPLAKAEDAKYAWKTVTPPLNFGYTDLRGSYVSPDGSKLFILVADNANNENLWMSEDDGVTCRLVDLYGLYAELLEVVTPVLCTALHVGLVLALGADRWDADELEEVLEEASFVLADIVLDLAHNRYGSKG